MGLNSTLQAIAEPNRRKILELLTKRNLSVGQLAVHFNITLPSLSHHLSVLKQADLVSSERRGQEIIYSINLSVVEEITKYLIKLFKK
ncbi:MAG: Transcriptional regulator, ArsR family [Candidatus Falkowbacteria bacterium GW2011_GWA2_39_24]|uniref:Transcriptional regulator, ArsR family n=1 Tax=Candidatus Falkowbacteria bacterium GW2011_GWA2_39_24 TaxID=1618634 RepID=A0A0G0RHK6_9BACT|nr:MAG: Transcriptional regulator, ArsR family [Candidatus Falkowbacteria bacterium GW2011_GWA2_39_24]